jgi:hypothetical protein
MQNSIFLCVSASLRCFLLILSFTTLASAQDWAKPVLEQMQRLDLRDLGYPMVNEIPANSSAITALLAGKDGNVYGGTTGEAACLFVFEPRTNKVRPLGRIAGQQGIHHSLAEDAAGDLYVGTGRSVIEEFRLTPGKPGEGHVDRLLWDDIRRHFAADPGGHVYRYRPAKSNAAVKLAQMDCELEDLGIPVAHNAVYALTSNPARGELYGLSYPEGHFFVRPIGQAKVKDLGPVDREIVFHGPERHWRSLPRALVCDQSGRVFTSGTGGRLVYYCPRAGKLVETDVRVPGDYYRAQFFQDHAVVECFATARSGVIYGGTCDGYLFSFDPVKMKLVNLGKPRASRRVRGLSVGLNGKVYLVAGERSASRPCQAYCYDPAGGGFTELGLLIVDRSPYYYWRGYQFDAMVTAADGTLYLGESERRSHLFLLIPE